MKLNKRNFRLLVMVIIILSLTLFMFVNFVIMNNHVYVLGEAKSACAGLEENDVCSFEIFGDVVEGKCMKKPRDNLVCKTPGKYKLKNISS